jgi:hypothetical protein
MTFTLDSTIGDILADPNAAKVLDQYVPGASQHPMLAMAKDMSLRTVLSMPQALKPGLPKTGQCRPGRNQQGRLTTILEERSGKVSRATSASASERQFRTLFQGFPPLALKQ